MSSADLRQLLWYEYSRVNPHFPLYQRFPNFFDCGTVRDFEIFNQSPYEKKHLFIKQILLFNKN